MRRPDATAGVAAPGASSALVVGFLGYSAPQKGRGLIGSIVRACAKNARIRFVVIGESNGMDTTGVEVTGRYGRGEAGELLRRYKVDVVVLPSPWPETFSYTLSEAWAVGVPAIVGPLGAPADRVRETGAGVVVDAYHVDSFVGAIEGLAASPGQLELLRASASAAGGNAATRDAYRALYRELGATSRRVCRFFSGGEAPGETVEMAPEVSPTVRRLWRWRAALFPAKSTRERVYLAARRLAGLG